MPRRVERMSARPLKEGQPASVVSTSGCASGVPPTAGSVTLGPLEAVQVRVAQFNDTITVAKVKDIHKKKGLETEQDTNELAQQLHRAKDELLSMRDKYPDSKARQSAAFIGEL